MDFQSRDSTTRSLKFLRFSSYTLARFRFPIRRRHYRHLANNGQCRHLSNTWRTSCSENQSRTKRSYPAENNFRSTRRNSGCPREAMWRSGATVGFCASPGEWRSCAEAAVSGRISAYGGRRTGRAVPVGIVCGRDSRWRSWWKSFVVIIRLLT